MTPIQHGSALRVTAALYLIALDVVVLGTSDGDILYIDRKTGEASLQFNHHRAHSKEITSLLALRDNSSVDHIYDNETATYNNMKGPQKLPRFVSCSKDRSLCVWTLQYAIERSGSVLGGFRAENHVSMISVYPQVLTGHLEDVLGALQLSKDNYIVSSSQDKTLRLWDLKNSYGSLCILQGHTSPITCFEEVPYEAA